MRAERRNISISNEKVSELLDRQQNVSKFIENCILAYIEEQETEYAKREELEEVKRDIQILNENYTATKEVLAKIANVLFKNN